MADNIKNEIYGMFGKYGVHPYGYRVKLPTRVKDKPKEMDNGKRDK
jgi:hypothetical protein